MSDYGIKIKLKLDENSKSSLETQIQNCLKNITANDSIGKIKLNVDRDYIRKQYSAVLKELASTKSNEVNGFTLIDTQQLATLKGQVTKVKNEIKQMQTASTQGSAQAAAAVNNETTAYRNKSKEITNAYQSLQRLNTANEGLLKKITNVGDGTKVNDLVIKQQEIQAEIAKTSQLNETERQQSIAGITQKIAALNAEIAGINKVADATRTNAATETSTYEQTNVALSKRLTLLSQLQKYADSNPRVMSTSDGKQINDIMTLLRSGANISPKNFTALQNQFKQIKVNAEEAGIAGKTMGDKFSAAFKKFGNWFGVSQLFMQGVHGVRQMIKTVTELDTAMTELKKVTDLTEETYERFVGKAENIAVSVGATIKDAINATADFSRLGYNIDDATALAQTALLYKNVGDGIDDISEASESVISTMKAFDIEAENSMSIIDKFNEVGNNYAISSEGIGTALKKSAAALAAGGNSLEESIGLAVGMNSVVQNPEIVGTALKTLSMYLRAAKTEAEEAGESTEGMAKSISELRDELLILTDNKVDIMVDENNFKSTTQIIRELSNVWGELKEIDQANILEMIAGKRNANSVSSLITNFEDVENAIATATNSEGSALAENEKYLNSIEGKSAQLKANFEALSENIFDSDGLKLGLDILIDILETVNNIIDRTGALPALITAIVGALSMKNVGELIKQFHC